MAWKIDETDRKIMEILRENARIANEKLGEKIGLSEPAARRRVANLISRRVIRRFTVDIEEGGAVSALVYLSTSPHASSDKVFRQLKGQDGVGSVWEVSGDMDFALTLAAQDMDALNRRVDELRALDSIRKTKTSIIMKKWK